MKYLNEHEQLLLEEISRVAPKNRTIDEKKTLADLESVARARFSAERAAYENELADILMVQAGTLSIEEY